MEVERLEVLVGLKSLSRNSHHSCLRDEKIWCGAMTWIQDANADHTDAQLGDKEGIFGDCLLSSEGCEETDDGFVIFHSEGTIPFLPIRCVPI